ncbi:MAG: hypothetical protein ABI904_09625 [Chloroflexota bacterium]
MKRLPIILAILIPLTACGRLDTLPYTPAQTPATWLQIQPYAEFNLGSQRIIFVQPSTSFIVYLLGILTIAIGLYFLKIREGHRSRLWWGIALLLWGIGALLAGTSYEAFSYAIKCAGREVCLWTSWWEALYLIVSVWSIDAMMLAVAYSSADGSLRKWLSIYAILNAVIYFIIVIVGVFIPVKFLISFELLLAVAAPSIIAFFIINGVRYFKSKHNLDLVYLGTWLWLGVTIAAYLLYLISGNTEALWTKGQWFSANDVLHLGLILWMLYIRFILAPRLSDLPVNA